ncbi:MAG TPA: NADH-quinone oxidoreductase subunit NuoE [Candidatus Polarisedimenticolia bacterium]|nr:NADH-quinone oxidoreductase subunit NuoE [Candidatus Polarisedimenticolia bacterium]
MNPSEETRKRIDAAIKEYPRPRSALLAVLHLIQAERGYVAKEDQEWVAQRMQLPSAEVAGVVSFYTMFRTAPPGRHHLQVCRTLSCQLRGCRELLQHIRAKLGIAEGGVTPDGRFSLVTVECLGSCGTAPMMQVNDDYHENLTRDGLDALLDSMK